MTEIQVLDEGGDSMTMVNFGHFRVPLFGKPVEYIRDVNVRLPDFQFRDNNILVLSYPKAGCTWTFEILAMLLEGKADGPVISKMDGMLEATSPDNIDDIPSPRLLNSHLPYRRLPASFAKKKVKVVFVVRNPKDVAVSLYNMMSGMKHYHYDGKFSNWLPLFLRGELVYDSFTRYHRDYEQVYTSQQHDMIILYFEDIKENTLEETKRLADFLGLSLSPDLLKDVATKCQFREMKTRFTSTRLGSSSYKDGKNYGFMRKGEVGDWKYWFTVAQSEMMDAVIQKEMKDSMFKFTYQL